MARAEAAAAAREAAAKPAADLARTSRRSLSPSPPSSPSARPPVIAKPQLSSQGYAASASSWTEWAQRLAPWRDLVSPVVIGGQACTKNSTRDLIVMQGYVGPAYVV